MARVWWTVIAALGVLVVAPLTAVEGLQDQAKAQGKAGPKAKAKASPKANNKKQALVDHLEAAFDAAARRARLKEDEPGVIVAVVGRAGPLFRKGFGLANLDKRTKIGPSTTFELASDSKMMTGYALLLLVQGGRVKLDDEVRAYIPEFPDYGPKDRVLVHHLVHHTSGLPEYTDAGLPEHGDRAFVTNEDYGRNLGALKARFHPAFRPGSRFRYSNTNYMLLGLILERVGGQSYGQFLKRRVFDPLGMTGAWVNDRPRVTPEVPGLGFVNAVGYSREKGGRYAPTWGAHPDRQEVLLTAGDGAIWCNIEDMIRWESCLRERKHLSPGTWRLAFGPSRLSDGKPNDYGFGLGIDRDPAGHPVRLWHGGSWGGFLSSFDRDVTRDLSVIVLSNRGDLDASAFSDALAEAVR